MDTNPSTKLQNFFSEYKSHYYKRRDIILPEKQIPAGIYYIVDGVVRTMVLKKDGKELTNTLLGPQDLFPIFWALYDKLSTHTFQAISKAEIKIAPKEDFVSLLKGDPTISLYTFTKLINRLEGVASRFETTLLGTAYERVVNVLLFIAESLGTWQKHEITISIPVTHQDLAEMTGLTRETVTLEMDKLRKEGFLSTTEHGLVLQKALKESQKD